MAKTNVYEMIRAVKLKNSNWGKQKMYNHFKTNRQFKDRTKEAGLEFSPGMFHSALEWIDNNPVSQKT